MTDSFSTKSCRPKSTPVHIPMPEDMKKLMNELEKKGHTCIMYCGIIQPKLTWCQKDICTEKKDRDDMHKRQEEKLALIKRLKKEGHKCVIVRETYPVQVSWCKQNVCTE
jgi:hypothetical protein